MTFALLLKSSTRRAILHSCLAISLVAASVPARAENPPKFKNSEVTASVQKFSDCLDALGAAVKAKDKAKMDEVGNEMDALVNNHSDVFTKDGKLQPSKATAEENAAFQKWLAAEVAKSGIAQEDIEERATKSLAQARQIGLALKLWAADNDGEYPANFDALFPQFLTDKKLLVSPFAPDQPVGYTYHPGLKDDGDPKAILLEDKFAPKASGQKIVVHLDNSGEVTK